MKHIYLAGPLFTAAEQKQRIYESNEIRRIILKSGKNITVFSPMEAPINDGTQPPQDIIFETDALEIDQADIFFFDLDNDDGGTMVEIGMVIQKIRSGQKGIKIYPIISDFRALANSRLGHESTWGGNSFVNGSFIKYGYKIFSSFEIALEQFQKDISLN